MNVLDRLKEKSHQQPDSLTALDGLVLACADENLQYQAAAELSELRGEHVYKNKKDMYELKFTNL